MVPAEPMAVRTAPQQSLYRGYFHCMATTARIEGVAALWKGATAQWLRVGPYTILLFLFAERLKLLVAETRANRQGGREAC